jgi:ankyrin repeat protein
MTRSGRCYTPEELEKRRKGKDNVGEEPFVTFPEEEVPVKEPVTERDVEDFLKYVKNSEYSIIEQLSKTPAKISLLSLILHSDLHRKALLKVLNESHISSNASVAQVERLVGQIQAPNYLTFSDEELGPESRGHNKPLSIAVSYKDFHITKVLIDNGSYINVLPKSTFDSLNIDPHYERETYAEAKA